MAKLLVQESTGVREFELMDAEIHIGRELDNALRLSDPSISRHHAILRKVGEVYELQDLQSSNGVLVNGTRIQTATVQDGDRLTLGQVQLTFQNPQPTVIQNINPLGTVRLNSEEVAKLQATPSVPSVPLLPPVPTVPSIALDEPPPAPMPPPPPVAPTPAPAQMSFTAQPVNPAPSFLQFLLPPVPDEALPTGERGDFVTRLLSHILDGLIFLALVIVVVIVTAILGAILGRGVAMIVGVLLYVAATIGYIIFIPWCWIRFGASPGKKIMKLRVVPEANPESRIDLTAAILRLVGHWVSGMLFDLPYLLVLGSERKGLQDIFSKSIVIKVDR